MITEFREFLEDLEDGLSSEFQEEELNEFLQMAKDTVKDDGFYHGPKRTLIKASSFALFALGMRHLGFGIASKKAHYDKMKEDLDQQFDQQVGKSPRRNG